MKKGDNKKEKRENYSYVTFPKIVLDARRKAFNESPSKTLSSKIEELLINYISK